MTVENPYVPPSYGTRHLAVERRIAQQEAEAEAPAEEPAKKPAKKKAD